MRTKTFEEMEHDDDMADAWIEEEKIRRYEEALEKESQKGSASL